MYPTLTTTSGQPTKISMTLDPEQRAKASQALLAQSTVKKPSMALSAATAALEQFFKDTQGLAADAVAKKVGADLDLQNAAVAFLKWRLSPLGKDAIEPGKSYATASNVALGVVQWSTPARKAEVLDTVFNTSHPAMLGQLHPLLLTAYTPEALEKAVLEKAASKNELHQMNALSLPYHVFGRKPDFKLSAKGHAALLQRLAAAQNNAALNPLAREVLGNVKLPDPK